MTDKPTPEILQAIQRGYAIIQQEQEAQEAAEKATEAEYRAKWDQVNEQLSQALPEILRPYMQPNNGDYYPSPNTSFYTVVIDIPGLAPIHTEVIKDPLLEAWVADQGYEVPHFYDFDDENDLYWVWRQKTHCHELDVALALAHEKGMQAAQAKRIREEQSIEPVYAPVEENPIIVNPLLGELTEYIRGIVDERIEERNF